MKQQRDYFLKKTFLTIYKVLWALWRAKKTHKGNILEFCSTEDRDGHEVYSKHQEVENTEVE